LLARLDPLLEQVKMAGFLLQLLGIKDSLIKPLGFDLSLLPKGKDGEIPSAYNKVEEASG